MKNDENNSVEIHYMKNPMYRTIHCDGAIGGHTPLREINLNFYSTRNTIPKSIKYEINKDGFMGAPIEVGEGSKSGLVREIEFGLYMSEKTGKEIFDFLKRIYEPTDIQK